MTYVLVQKYSYFKEDIEALGEHFKDYRMIERVEILPYHTLGREEFYYVNQWGPAYEADRAIEFIRTEGTKTDPPFAMVVSMVNSC